MATPTRVKVDKLLRYASVDRQNAEKILTIKQSDIYE